MPRSAREISVSGFYHIMFRGINHQNIFEEEIDYRCFLESLKDVRSNLQFEVHAYCLMTNHVHLLIKERQMGDISVIMKKVLTRYVMYFNRKYGRSGALIANRYKSKPVEDERYIIPLTIYIHQNPVKAGLVKDSGDYLYSSYHEYFGVADFVQTEFVLGLVDQTEFLEMHKVILKEDFGISESVRLTAQEVYEKMKEILAGREPQTINALAKKERNAILVKLRNAGFSIREIERGTGVPKGVVENCGRKIRQKRTVPLSHCPCLIDKIDIWKV